MNYQIHTKVNWQEEITSDWEYFFYPSLVKKIKKSNEYFNSLFHINVNELKNVEQAHNFFQLYDAEIVSRKNYIYEPEYQKKRIEKSLYEGKKYILVDLILNEGDKYAGGIIMRISDTSLIFSLRTIDSSTRASFRSVTTVDFWLEKVIYDYAVSKKFNVLSHGTDSYPNKGRTGLALYKLKVGMKPKISPRQHELLVLSDADLAQFGTSIFFWDNPDENGFFKKAHLFYKEDGIDEFVLQELVKVINWSNLKLELHEL